MGTTHTEVHHPSSSWIKLLLLQTPYSVTSAAIAAILAAILLIFSTGCSTESKPAPPKPGTIGYSWFSAGEAYRQGDYIRANDHLSRLVSARSEYRDRARVWALVVSSGVATGYRELADAYEAGGRINRAQIYDYRDRAGKARRAANQATMMFVESLHEYMAANKGGTPAFDFDFPEGKISEPLQLTKLNKGITLQPADHEVLERAMIERAVVRMATEMAGVPGDIDKGKLQFKQPGREGLLAAMARSIYDNADLYSPRKLDEPRRMHVLCKEALAVTAELPAGKDKKELEAKIQALMKKHPIKEG
jgi:hypothetical protein